MSRAFAGTPQSNKVSFDPTTNTYSGGNVGGDVSINGASPGSPGMGGGLVARAFDTPPAAAKPPAGQSLIDRAFSMQPQQQVPQFNAPQVAHSGNDWEARNNLRNLEVSASSITNNGGAFDSRRGRINGPSLAQAAFQDAARADLSARAEQPRLDMATNQVNAGLQREGMEQQGNQQRSLVQAMLGQQANQTELQKANIAADSGMQRSMIDALGSIEAAKERAAAASRANAPAGYRFNTSGGLEAIPGGPADKSQAPLNDVQSKALQFGSRMQEADKTLSDLANQGVNQPGLFKRAADAVGMGAAANWTQSAEQQKVEQSQRDFINAVLRRESGAAISDGEFANARQQYFPQPGDSPEVIDQKLKNRAIATAGIKAEVPNSEQRIGQVVGAGNAAVAANTGNAQVTELQRRAASDPALAARLKEMGY
ncbi:hypothetical protein [Comamonas odontotermitis]|uniref:hypothetical protein n=1 Tax=Comamonas odontotermitis TaxID=379895 RepID=UPI001CC656E6|nr:hypothetical protein [Comamonas odontotermitis]UBB15429.1 hypothetical protein LAD35_11140 [Comamonas odontotermitis]